MADYDIFISYRRVGGADFARQMQLALKTKGYNVFLDFDELKDGVFDRRIETAIKSSKVFIFILSPHSLDRCKSRNRRLADAMLSPTVPRHARTRSGQMQSRLQTRRAHIATRQTVVASPTPNQDFV